MWGEFALLVNAFEHGFTAVFQLAQIAKPLLQFTQLDVVQPPGRFLAVARDEGHGGAAIKQFHGGLDLVFVGLDFSGNLADDFLHVHFR